MAIEFYSRREEYGALSNFSPHGIEMDGLWYPTVEHYFQAMKFPGHSHAERIRCAASPKEAKSLGRTRKVALRDDWEEVKIELMRLAVRAKFSTHRELTQLLLGTGDEELIEAAPSDYFWGCGKSGGGQNWLGRILMEVREQMKEEEAKSIEETA